MVQRTHYLGVPGDVTGDGLVSVADVGPFVNVMLGNIASACMAGAADMNADGEADGEDIQLFVQRL